MKNNSQLIIGIVVIIVLLIVVIIAIPPLLDEADSEASPTATTQAGGIPFDDVTEDAPSVDTETPAEVPTSDVLLFPNLEIVFDDTSLTLRNTSSLPLDLNELVLRSDSGEFQATQWGVSADNLAQDQCLQIHENATGAQQLSACTTMLDSQSVGSTELFWLNVSTFDVVYNNSVIGTCTTSSSPCLVAIP